MFLVFTVITNMLAFKWPGNLFMNTIDGISRYTELLQISSAFPSTLSEKKSKKVNKNGIL